MNAPFPPRDSKHRYYQHVGACIYCGDTDALTDEHIIPLSLGGIMILPKSSCKKCAKITHAFEYTCARKIFGAFRMRHKLPTRRKKERPTHVSISTEVSGTVSIPVTDYPAPTMVFKFGTANLLAGFRPGTGIFQWEPVILASHEEMLAAKAKRGWDMTVTVQALPNEYARLLAKIGYAYAVANLGLGNFQPLTVDVILGKSDSYGDVVGGSMDIQPAVPDAGTLLSVEGRLVEGRLFIVVGIRLFASIGTPSYHVVVGAIDTPAAIRSFLEQHGDPQLTEYKPPI